MASTLDILAIKVQSEGITKASRELDNLGKSADTTEKKILKLVDSVNSMIKQFASSVSGTKAMTDALAVVNRTTVASDAAMKALTGSIGKLSSEIANMNARMQNGVGAVTSHTVTIRHNTAAMTDAHAAARGLTGSLGALWLTYGNVAPLAAGAAIGASLKQIVTIGVDVENTLENIRIKGENTTQGMVEMRKAIVDLGQGVYGPQEIVKALETLTLAGLKAKDAVNAIGAAQNLAIVGGTDINKAAESLVTIGTAVGATSKEYDYLADGIAKAANISLASVESIGEAVKRASVVNKLYGASFEDILTQTAALAQLGIKNTAAGTAITNFYANALGGTEKAKKALDELGFSFQDATGKAKPLVAAYTEFTEKLNNFDLKSQQKIITDIFGERALRDVEGLRDLVNQAAESTERLADGTLKYKNRLEEVQGAIADSAGTSALQAAQMAQTTENQIKAMLNTLKSSFGAAFSSIEPQIRDVVAKLKEVFGSPEFITAITNTAKAFASLANVIADLIRPAMLLGEAFLAYATITAGGALFSRLIPYVGGLAIQMGLLSASTTAATIATTGLGRAITLLPGIGMILGAAAAAYALYTLNADNATKSTSDLAAEKAKMAEESNAGFLKSLEDEASRLEKVNQKLAIGLTLQQAELQTTKELALEKDRNVNKESVSAAEVAVMAARKEFAKVQFSYTAKQSKEYENLVSAQNALNTAKAKAEEFDKRSSAAAQKIIDYTKQQKEQLEINTRSAEFAALGKSGEKAFGGGVDKEAKKALTFFEDEKRAILTSTEAYKAKTAALLESYETGSKVAAESAESAVMVNKLMGKYASDSAYQAQLQLAREEDLATVSYTHLTLPTIYSV